MLFAAGMDGELGASSGVQRMFKSGGRGTESVSFTEDTRVRRFAFSSPSSGGGVSAALGFGSSGGAGLGLSGCSCRGVSDEMARLER